VCPYVPFALFLGQGAEEGDHFVQSSFLYLLRNVIFVVSVRVGFFSQAGGKSRIGLGGGEGRKKENYGEIGKRQRQR